MFNLMFYNHLLYTCNIKVVSVTFPKAFTDYCCKNKHQTHYISACYSKKQ